MIQYERTGFDSIVDAIYQKPLVSSDKGNIYIEALPHPVYDSKECIAKYTKGIKDYDYSEAMQLPKETRLFSVGQLKSVRVFLPFCQELEQRFYETLCESYRLRRPKVTYKGDEINITTVGNVCDSAVSGFAIVGRSGCGKSSSIASLLSTYPQVIYHTIEGVRFPQIVYLMVSCVPNSNFNALYASIGKAIDRALGVQIYESAIKYTGTLGGKLNYIERLVEKFGIGMIILDEIQLLKFSNIGENTFESFLTLSNETKVAVSVVGTEDALNKMETNLRTRRRVKYTINASTYTENKQYYGYLVDELLKYQWTDEQMTFDKACYDELYKRSRGIVDFVVSIIIALQTELIMSKKRTINPQFIADTTNKYFKGLGKLISKYKEVSDSEISAVISDGMKKINDASISQDEIISMLISKQKESVMPEP